MTALEQTLQKYAKEPMTQGELEIAAYRLSGAVMCLLKMRTKIIDIQAYINQRDKILALKEQLDYISGKLAS